MKRSILTIALLTIFSSHAFAAENQWKETAMDAWIDGKAESTILFNNNLNSFDINTDVDNSVVTLTGRVDNDLEKKLAGELIMGIDGVSAVNNKISIIAPDETSDTSEFTDTKINAVVKSRLLFNSEVSGTNIDVDVNNKIVTLDGTVDSDAEKDLAITIAENADDVESVIDNLSVVADSE